MSGVARVVGLGAAAIVIAAGAYALLFPLPWRSATDAGTRAVAAPAAKSPSDANSVTLGEGDRRREPCRDCSPSG